MFIAVIVALALVVGTSITAQGAVPGETLYPVKIHLNENVESVLSLSPEGDARVKAAHALRRLDEAQELATSAKLNASAQAEIISRFEEDVSVMEHHIQELEARGDMQTAAEIRSVFEASLNNRSSALVNVSSGSSEIQTVITEIAGAVHARMSASAYADADTRVDTRVGTTSTVEVRNRIDLGL